MLRRSVNTLLAVSALLSIVSVANCWQTAASPAPAKAAASAPQALKEKIVFVRSDPSQGVSSMRSKRERLWHWWVNVMPRSRAASAAR